jgi:hypothetical protein
MDIRSGLIVTAALIACGGCATAWAPSVRYLPQDGADCMSERYARDSCIIAIPQVGYLNVVINTLGPDQTDVTIRLAPDADVDLRWASKDLVLVDLDSGTTSIKTALPTRSVRGTREHGSAGYLAVLYGPNLYGQFHLPQRINHAELRFPDVVASSRTVRGLRFRYDDGPRMRVPVPAYHSH